MEKNNDTEIESSKNETLEDFEEGADDIQTLAEELETSRQLAAEYLDQLQRLQAEFDNYKKRVDKEKTELTDYANANLISELIDVMENLERGMSSAAESEDIDSVTKGMELVYNQLKGILEAKGLVPIEALNQKFDPYRHEAMMKTPTDEYPNNTVIEEFQKGYMLKDRVIRYSKVKVSTNEENNKRE